jgi:hypothetical protein
MKTFLIAVSLCMIATGATAQITLSSPTRYEPDQVVRITSSFRTTVKVVDGHADAKSQEAARAELYRLAVAECGLLIEIHKGDCRLTGLNINNIHGINQLLPPDVMVGTATYELRRKPNP